MCIRDSSEAAPAISGASSADSTSAGPAQAQNQAPSEGGGINGFALILLFALLLIAGGAYIYWMMTKRRDTEQTDSWSEASAGGFSDEADDNFGSSGVISGFDRSALQPATTQPAPPRPAPASTFSPRSYSTMNTSPPVSGPPGFEPEDDFNAGAKTSAAYYSRLEDDGDEDAVPASALLLEEEDDEELEEVVPSATPVKVAAPPRTATPSRFELSLIHI